MQLKNIPLDEIIFGERQRVDYGDIEDLALSIRDKELINPITVTTMQDGKYKLAAGGRRYTACKHLGHYEIPCRVYDKELSEIELRSIEIEENIKRKDFTFLEECQAKRDLLKIQQQLHGEKTSTSPKAEGISMRDIASVLGVSAASLSQDIKLAETVSKFPNIGWEHCKTKSEAMKLQNKIEETYIRAELAKRAEAAIGSKNLFLNKICNAYQICDCRDGIKELPNDYFNLVEIDPPYAIDLHSQKKGQTDGYDGGKYNEIHPSQYEQLMKTVFAECYRVMVSNSWLLCWFGPTWLMEIKTWLRESGFNVFDVPALWLKPTGQTNHPSTILANCYEMFFYARKGNPVMVREGQNNVFPFSRISQSKQCHPTERPIELIETLLSLFANEGSRVLVPFAGSGNTLLAAAKLRMIPIGYDLTPEYRNSYILKCQELFGPQCQ